MIKLVHDKDRDLYDLRNLELRHLHVIFTLISNTRLGDSIYEKAAFDLAELMDNVKIMDIKDCNIAFAVENEPIYYVDDITIELSHVTD